MRIQETDKNVKLIRRLWDAVSVKRQSKRHIETQELGIKIKLSISYAVIVSIDVEIYRQDFPVVERSDNCNTFEQRRTKL